MEVTEEQKIKDLENFLKNAFNTDGKCTYKGGGRIVSENGNSIESITFILEDSRNGRMIISLAK